MKQIILPSTILEFAWLVIDYFLEENGLVPPVSKIKLGPAALSPQLQDTKKKLTPHQKNICGWGGSIYHLK